MKLRNSAQPTVRRLNPIVLIGSLLIVAAVVAVPFYSAKSGSLTLRRPGTLKNSTETARPRASSLTSPSARVGAWASSLLPVSSHVETIATFASDCTTPRTDFVLGETVCAVTSGVTETDRFVNWCVSCPTIAHGGAGVTDITSSAPQSFLYTPTVSGTWKATIADPTDSSIIPTVFTVGPQTADVATYASDCVTPKTKFSLGDQVCAKAIVSPGFRFSWVDPGGFVQQTAPITTNPATDSYTLPTATTTQIMDITVQNVGVWRVNIITPRSSLRASAFFSVEDNTQSNVDLSIYLSGPSEPPDAGGSVQYAVKVTNNGPNDAANVHFKDETFVNATLNSVTQTGGLTNAFTCSSAGTVDCAI